MHASILRNGWLWVAVTSAWAAACGSSGSHTGSPGTGHGGSSVAGASGAGKSGAGSAASDTGGSAGSSAGSGGSSNGGSAGTGAGGLGTSGRGDAGESGDTGTAATAGDGAPGGAGSGNESGGSGGKGGSGGASTHAGEGGEGGEGATGGVAQTDKVDLLLVVDNSISMFEKQKLLAAAVPKLVLRLVDPWCVGGSAPAAPAAPGHVCPDGRHLESEPVNDLHVGVITTSLGDHGSNDICSDEQNANNVSNGLLASDYNDKGQLLPLARPSANLPSWNQSGFLNWDPLHKSTPTGQDVSANFIADLVQVMSGVGAHGCGYESTLEAMYRFLVDPEPPKVIDHDTGTSKTTVSTDPSNTDTDLLAQRAAFLRPDSALVIISLSDEDDCSINDDAGQQGWLTSYKGGVAASSLWHMPRARAVCATDPNDACCGTCPGPSGCSADPVCATGSLTSPEDSMNMRCFAQKQRFGTDFLYPLERYARGLTGSTVPRRSGGSAPNPLYTDGRDERLITYMPIVGVPWQDLAKDPEDDEHLDLMTASELRANDHWPALVGDFAAGEPPTDPFMVPSIDPRTNLVPSSNPFSGDPILPDTGLDPLATINGHEQKVTAQRDDLQLACIFPLTTPVDCSTDLDECDCTYSQSAYNRPLCQAPGGTGSFETNQYFAKAYPGVRHLEVARRVADVAQVASICPRNSTTSSAEDYGYLPAMRALQARISAQILTP